ncbi:MAG: O-antigen ligase family protein, partial [Lachnospiraceae bacterium]|nr:O-antigen ligase family protein [Lachnospiraceae bacterium]
NQKLIGSNSVRKLQFIQIGLTAVTVLIVLMFCFQTFWNSTSVSIPVYAALGLISAITIGCCVCFLQRRIGFDLIALAAFFAVAWLSSILAIGFNVKFIYSAFVCISLSYLAVYNTFYSIPDYEKLIKTISAVIAVANSAICIFVLINASRSLFYEEPLEDKMNGCFTGWRLCGLHNPNSMAMICLALLLISVFGIIKTQKTARILYSISAFLGWFTLGLTGSRTSQLAFSATACLFVFALLQEKARKGIQEKKRVVIRIIFVLIIAIAVTALVFVTFALPTFIYKGIMFIIAKIINNEFLLNNVIGAAPREINVDPTASGRLGIWKQVLRDISQDSRHLLFGISYFGEGMIHVSVGETEIVFDQSHNIILEWTRKFGLVGLIAWLFPLGYWVVNGVKLLFSGEERTEYRYLAAGMGGLLLTGMAETSPFYPGALLAPLFFLICGLCVRLNRDREAQKAGEAPAGTLSETPEERVE